MRRFFQALSDISGASNIEYSLLAGLIAVVVLTGIASVGNSTHSLFTKVNSGMSQSP